MAATQVKEMLVHAHPRTFALRGLQKYCIAVCLRWLAPSLSEDGDMWNEKSVAVAGVCSLV